jgi:hypothetical protein
MGKKPAIRLSRIEGRGWKIEDGTGASTPILDFPSSIIDLPSSIIDLPSSIIDLT